MLSDIVTLDQYLTAYGQDLCRQTGQSINPLHSPDRHKPCKIKFLRKPFDPQAHMIAATAKGLDHGNAILVVAECGTGKTLMGMAAAHAHAAGRPYRGLVLCPPQLTNKWEREILETIPGAKTRQISGYGSLVPLRDGRRPDGPEWWVVSETTAKAGAQWRPAFVLRRNMKEEIPRCSQCGRQIMDSAGCPIPLEVLENRKHFCQGTEDEPGCGAPLWQYADYLGKWSPADFIHRHLKNAFDYLICDEIHEENSRSSARAEALGSLAASCRKTIGLTGTLFAGYAWHVRSMLFRISPQSLVAEGMGWSDLTLFNSTYGRIETKTIETTKDRNSRIDNKRSKGSSRRTVSNVQPGVMPPLFGRHLIDKAVFLTLDELAEGLPEFTEEVIAVKMDDDLRAAYRRTEDALKASAKQMMARGDKRLLGSMLQCLMAYPDHPYDWEQVGYWETTCGDNRTFIPVVRPRQLSKVIRPKEARLLKILKAEKRAGRQCWVYVNSTDKYDVAARLESLIAKAGLAVRVLRSSVETSRREEWIAKNAPGLDVVISHPRLVRTGLDLFDKGGKHNFSSLVFYQTGYDLFTLRQAARRSWRIGQRQACKVYYLFWKDTMQDRAMTLMGRKLAASEAIEGQFSSEGLAALCGDDEGSIQTALAKSLIANLSDLDAGRTWTKIGSHHKPHRSKQKGTAHGRSLRRKS